MNKPGPFEPSPDGLESEQHYLLKLYISGTTTRSTKAIAAIREICEEHLEGRYSLDIVDIYQQPEAAKEAQLLAAPTLVKEFPLPVRHVIGDMSDETRVIAALEILPPE